MPRGSFATGCADGETREEREERREGGSMGILFSKLFSYIAKGNYKIIIVGLDNAGKTTTSVSLSPAVFKCVMTHMGASSRNKSTQNNPSFRALQYFPYDAAANIIDPKSCPFLCRLDPATQGLIGKMSWQAV